MFSIKVMEENGHYTVHGCSSYNVGKTADGFRSVSYWGKGGLEEPGLVLVGEGYAPVVYIMNGHGKTIDAIWPFPQPEPSP